MHILQLKSPGLKAAVQSQKANPETPRMLQLLISQAMAEMKTFLSDPEGSAKERLGEAGMRLPGPQSNPGATA